MAYTDPLEKIINTNIDIKPCLYESHADECKHSDLLNQIINFQKLNDMHNIKNNPKFAYKNNVFICNTDRISIRIYYCEDDYIQSNKFHITILFSNESKCVFINYQHCVNTLVYHSYYYVRVVKTDEKIDFDLEKYMHPHNILDIYGKHIISQYTYENNETFEDAFRNMTLLDLIETGKQIKNARCNLLN